MQGMSYAIRPPRRKQNPLYEALADNLRHIDYDDECVRLSENPRAGPEPKTIH